MNTSTLTSSVLAASRRARAAAAAALAVLALGMTVLVAPSASASSTRPWDFSSKIPGNPTHSWLVDDCYGDLGFVFDGNLAATGWHHIGGARVDDCLSWHKYISIRVAMYYSNGSSWVQYGNSTYRVWYNAASSGYDIYGILDTPAYCMYGWKGKWIVGATVSTERASQTVFSQVPAYDLPGDGAC
jgi:hypothetical protein